MFVMLYINQTLVNYFFRLNNFIGTFSQKEKSFTIDK